MVKQRGIRKNNQKELTQKGMNIKKKSSHQERSSRRSTAASRKQSGVLSCRSWWLGWQRVGPAVTPTAHRQCWQTGCAATSLYGTVTMFRTFPSLWTTTSLRTITSFWTTASFRTARFGVLTHQCRSGARRCLSEPGQSSSVPGLLLGL